MSQIYYLVFVDETPPTTAYRRLLRLKTFTRRDYRNIMNEDMRRENLSLKTQTSTDDGIIDEMVYNVMNRDDADSGLGD